MQFDLSVFATIANQVEPENDGTFNKVLGANISPICESNEIEKLSEYIDKYAIYSPNPDMVGYLKLIKNNLENKPNNMDRSEQNQRAIGSAIRYGHVPDEVRETLKSLEIQEIENMKHHLKEHPTFKSVTKDENRLVKPVLVTEDLPKIPRKPTDSYDDFNDEFTEIINQLPELQELPTDRREEFDSELNAEAYIKGI